MIDFKGDGCEKSGFDSFPTFDTLWINKNRIPQQRKKKKKMNGFQRQVSRTKRKIARRMIGCL